ncbi:hypothetical protein D3C72_1309200 [compost metagenome]
MLDQNSRMPMRTSAVRAIRPVPMSAAMNRPPSQPILLPADEPRPRGLSSASSMANLPTKPDSGGRPEITRVQTTNDRPRNAMEAGITRPISTSSSSSRFSPSRGSNSGVRKGASSSSNRTTSLPSVRQRSIRSANRKSTATARVELGR